MSKKILILLLISPFLLSGCEELISKSFDNETLKKLRSENTNLRIQIDKQQRELKAKEEKIFLSEIMIDLYDLRHAMEKYALSHRGEYPETENLKELTDIVKIYLPKEYSIDITYLETVRSSAKGYIFIANVNGNKIVISNLI